MDLNQSDEAKQLFLEYIKFDRNSFSRSGHSRKTSIFSSSVNISYLDNVTEASDISLIREYLLDHFMVKENESFEPFISYFDEDLITKIAAEGKLYSGADEVKWVSKIPSSEIQPLKEKVEIQFLPCNKNVFSMDDEVKLQVYLKNVSQVITKIFELNTLGYYLQHFQEIDTSINLDGLIAREENQISLEDSSPFMKCRKEFSFPSINKSGVYVVEIIGNGISSRALIRKGELHLVESMNENGHCFHILNEKYELLKQSSIYLHGNSYKSNEENGEIIIPFSNVNSQEKKIIISSSDDGFACLSSFQHLQESYSMNVGISLDREQLTPGTTAKVLIHPKLFLCKLDRISLSKLNNLTCIISARTLKSNQYSKIHEITFNHDSNSLHDQNQSYETTFTVPVNLQDLSFEISSKLNKKQSNEEIILKTSKNYSINTNQKTNNIIDCFLQIENGNYIISFIGRNGEPRKQIHSVIQFSHIFFRNSIEKQLESDHNGKINLGKLNQITRINVRFNSQHKTWNLKENIISHCMNKYLPTIIHCYDDELITIPISSKLPKLSKSSSLGKLVSIKNNQILNDFSSSLQFNYDKKQIQIQCNSIPFGSYQIQWKYSSVLTNITILPRNSIQINDWIIYNKTFYQYISYLHSMLSISNVCMNKKSNSIQIQLENYSNDTKIHLIASHLYPLFNQFDQLSTTTNKIPSSIQTSFPSCFYASGRELSDEIRYIIDRKYIDHYPHLLLEKPTLLSNPYATMNVSDSQGFCNEGDNFQGVNDESGRCGYANALASLGASSYSDISCIDFLQSSSVILSSLSPNSNGIIEVPLEKLKHCEYIQIIAFDKNLITSYENSLFSIDSSFINEESTSSLQLRNLSLTDSLPLGENFVEKSQISVVSANTKLNFQESGVDEEDLKIYDSLEKLFEYYTSKSNLSEFSFLLNWHNLTINEKENLYSKFACYELNMFLLKKDHSFFNSNVIHQIKLKKIKSFMDFYFLNNTDELKNYLNPIYLNKLNLFEKILLASIFQVDSLAKNIIDECLYFDIKKKEQEKIALRRTITRDFYPEKRRISSSIRSTSTRRKRRTSICRLSRSRSPPMLSRFDSCDSLTECNFDNFTYVAPSELDDLHSSVSYTPSVVQQRQQSKAIETTEYAEQGYYQTTQGNSITFEPSRFWSDYLKYLLEQQKKDDQSNHSPKEFISRNLLDVQYKSPMLFALAILDLPISSQNPQISFNDFGNVTHITSSCNYPLVVSYKELVKVSISLTSSAEAVSVVQCIYRDGSPDKFLSSNDDFLPGCVSFF